MKKEYRLYVIHMLPHIRTLDWNRVTQKVSLYRCEFDEMFN